MRIWLEMLWMWGMGGLQVHRIRSRRLLYKEVVEVRSNYKKSYFWWFGNPTCGDSTGSKQIEKDQDRVSDRLALGKRAERAVWFSARGAPSDDWGNGGYVYVLFTCGECGFGSIRNWSYSKELVKNFRTKSVSKWNVSRVTLQEFNIRYWFLWDSLRYWICVT